jgi:hypothetical protein
MLIVLCIACFVLSAAGFALCVWDYYRGYEDFNPIGIIALFVGIIFLVCGIVATCTTVNTVVVKGRTVEMRHVQLENTRNVLISVYEKYERLTDTDVTASTSYYQVYSDIINFNNEVIAAQTYGGQSFWAYVFYDPAYEGIRLIPLE